jgi:hypothetical protein
MILVEDVNDDGVVATGMRVPRRSYREQRAARSV